MKLSCFLLAAHCLCASLVPAADLSSLVNPFVGTGISSQRDYGKVHPGASLPFGMLYWSPDQAHGEFYDYGNPTIRGFSLTHISGPGCPTFGDVPLLPMLGSPRMPVARFDHANETAEPGYYSVLLDSGIRVQLAAALRAGIAQITFPNGSEQRTMLIDVAHNLTRVDDASVGIHGNHIEGSVTSGHFCGSGNRYKIYFAIETEQPPVASGNFDANGIGSTTDKKGPPASMWLSFPQSVRTLRLRAAVSYVSVGNAEANLREIEGWDFDRVRTNARSAWNKALGTVRVQGGSIEEQKVFYTALYHSFLHPSTFSDADGEYMGFDGQVHRAQGRVHYTNISGWDVYRSQVQLLAMLFPKRAGDIAESLVMDAEQSGGLPRWPIANDECGCMVGDPADLIIASVYAFGGRSFDTVAALRAMLKGANDPGTMVHAYSARSHLAEYLKNGYVAAAGKRYGPASISLEYESADFAISRFAQALGEAETARVFLSRSAQWKTLFDPVTRYIRPRDAEGKFLANFNPASEQGFVEGNAAQYTWMVPYDMKGVVSATGGAAAVNARLDEYFKEYSSAQPTRFNIANEPSFSNPWIYNWTGQPWRTQDVIRQTLDTLFHDAPGGLPGNDDLGATSSWIVFASLGIYPAIPAVGGFTLNTPLFPEATIQLGPRQLHISANGAPLRCYIDAVHLDKGLVRGYWISWNDLGAGSHITFSLSTTANRHPIASTPPSFAPKHR